MNHYSSAMSLLQCPPERRVSAVLFGNRHRLELLAALAHASDEGVNLSDLASVQGVSANVYYAPLRALLEAGLVDRLGTTPGDRRCWYRRRESTVWAGIRFLAAELAKAEAS